VNTLAISALLSGSRQPLQWFMPKKSTAPNDKLARLLDYQRALAGFSRVAADVMPLERLLHHAAAQVSRVTGIKRVKVLRYRPDRADLHLVEGVGWNPGVVGATSLSIDQASPGGRCLQTAAAVVIEDLATTTEFRISALLREHKIVSLLNVPVRVDGRVWGVFEVDSEVPRGFDDGDVGFLATFANMLGMALQRLEMEQSLLDSLAQSAQAEARSEVLLRELQHRVKNNFQVIISFLALQRRHVDPGIRSRFTSVMDRVHAIALAHDQLTFQNDSGQVEFGDYLRALCANIDPHLEGIVIEVEARRMTLPIDRAVPAGLIVNELVTNSIKYAFDERGGLIRVVFALDEDLGEASLIVEDNGRGLEKPRAANGAEGGRSREGGLGMTLIQAFAVQLDGHVETLEVEKGTSTIVRFPVAA
jgi:two-component sensor histidine kinase